MRRETDPDPAWVAGLSGREEGEVRTALAEAMAEGRLFGHLAREHAREGRESYIEIDAPLELYALVRLLRPQHVLEAGVSSGVSSAYLLRALQRNGRGLLHSIDLPSRPRGKARSSPSPRNSWSLPAHRDTGWAVPERLRPRWDLRLGDKADVLPILREQVPRFDLVVYDLPHDCEVLAREFRSLDPAMPAGAVLIVDHGPGGGLCPGLDRWARRRGSTAIRRSHLGLFGARAARGPRRRSARAD